MRFQSLMLRTGQYNRNTDSKEKNPDVCVCKGKRGFGYSLKTDLNIINSKLIKLLLKLFPVGIDYIQQYAEGLSYNLMWINSNNTLQVDQRI